MKAFDDWAKEQGFFKPDTEDAFLLPWQAMRAAGLDDKEIAEACTHIVSAMKGEYGE